MALRNLQASKKVLCMRTFFLTPEQYGEMKQRYERFNEPWSLEEVTELREMAADGLPRSEMAARLGRSPNAVRMKLQALGLYVPKPSARPWTEEEETRLVEQYRSGASFAGLSSRKSSSSSPKSARFTPISTGDVIP